MPRIAKLIALIILLCALAYLAGKVAYRAGVFIGSS